jgi:hypothetical protein
VLQADKDFVEFAVQSIVPAKDLTEILSNLHTIVILVVYTGEKI